jgi:UV DNA damage endonuclease
MPAHKRSIVVAASKPRRTSRQTVSATTSSIQSPGNDDSLTAPTVETDATTTKAARGKKRKVSEAKVEAKVERAVEEKAAGANRQIGIGEDPEEDGDVKVTKEDVAAALARPPPVNSDYLPLPWKGRLGFACLNTYLRNANPPVFSSRTCRIASILEHRHPLANPSEPEHPTKNRPDKTKPADVARGQRYVEALGLANARDIIKMVRWNDRYGIRFLRLSSEMFPFASHAEYGYQLEPFAADTLAAAGREIARLGHRVTTHPGQFTQLGSPRKPVIDASIRDLQYHDELLSLLKLPPQQDRDAVMILHMGGVFGDKAATLDRFRENYAKLPSGVKNRLVLENDDVSWSVHELLPICEELNIPFVLDFHHHNIIFDSEQIREGTKDIMDLFPRIIATWERKNITPKMHYSEPCDDAVTGRQRRKHRPRVQFLPPCPDTMDLMIEAKDKEQAVFELMRKYKLPGHESIQEMVPHIRDDENKTENPRKKKKSDDETPAVIIPEEAISMGGPNGRVYWPPGQEHWLRPPKRAIKKKDGENLDSGRATPTKTKRAGKPAKGVPDETPNGNAGPTTAVPKRSTAKTSSRKAKTVEPVLTPSPSVEDSSSAELSDLGEDSDCPPSSKRVKAVVPELPTRSSGRRKARVSYAEDNAEV